MQELQWTNEVPKTVGNYWCYGFKHVWSENDYLYRQHHNLPTDLAVTSLVTVYYEPQACEGNKLFVHIWHNHRVESLWLLNKQQPDLLWAPMEIPYPEGVENPIRHIIEQQKINGEYYETKS